MSRSAGDDAFWADAWRGANPIDAAYRDDPYPALNRLRELEPVGETPIGFWRLCRYADCVRLLREVPTGVRQSDGSLPGLPAHMEEDATFMLSQDPPAHTRLRKLVSRAFTPRAVARMRPHVEAIVADRLDRVVERGSLDVIADLALPVPSQVICEMLGVPLADRDRFTRWTAESTHGLARETSPADVIERADAASRALREYFTDLVAERRDRLGDDMLSTLIREAEDGDRLSHAELLSQATGLLVAGFETTIGLIGNGVRQLLLHPGELQKLRERPDLIGPAVEECLRYDGPIELTGRYVHADVEFGGRRIPRNTQVWAMLYAANRDPEAFPDPERFRVDRAPNPHLAFGGGAHLCLGAHLARLEAQLAIGGLVARFDYLELETPDRVEWGPSLFRVPKRLPVRFRE